MEELTPEQKMIDILFSHPNRVAYLHMVNYDPFDALMPAEAEAIRARGLEKGEFLLPLRVILTPSKD